MSAKRMFLVTRHRVVFVIPGVCPMLYTCQNPALSGFAKLPLVDYTNLIVRQQKFTNRSEGYSQALDASVVQLKIASVVELSQSTTLHSLLRSSI